MSVIYGRFVATAMAKGPGKHMQTPQQLPVTEGAMAMTSTMTAMQAWF